MKYPIGRKGVILILAVGILSVMSLIATSFALNMQLERKMALNYVHRVQAESIAEAGLNKAIAEIRKRAKEEPYSSLISGISASYPSNNSTEVVVDDSGSFLIKVQDESQKVNINTFTQTDASEINSLHSHGLSYDQIAKIIDYRDTDGSKTLKLYPSGGGVVCQGSEVNAKNSFFATIEEIKLIDGITEDDFEKVKEGITVNKPILRGGLLARYYKPVTVSFNYSQDNYLGAVVELGELRKLDKDKDMKGAESDEESHDAEFAGGYLMNKKTGNDWRLDQFGVIYEGYIYVLPEEVGGVSFSLSADDGARMFIDGEEAQGSFVFKYAGWHPLRIEYYDLGGDNYIELKWKGGEYVPAERLGYDPPTETDYNSAGIYKIISTGKIMSKSGDIIAEKAVSAVVEIFGVWTQTTRPEFSAAWAGKFGDYSDGEIKWVTWLDSCPTDEDKWDANKMQWEKGWDPVTGTGDYETIPDSLKLGYWDNFDEDVAYSVVNLIGDKKYGIYPNGADDWTSPEINFSYDNFSNATGTMDEDNEFIIFADPLRSPQGEINRDYYSSLIGTDIFFRIWEHDWGQYHELEKLNEFPFPEYGFGPNDRKSSPQGENFQPQLAWMVGAVAIETLIDPYMGEIWMLLRAGDGSYVFESPCSAFYNWSGVSYSFWRDYLMQKTLGFIANGVDFWAYVNGEDGAKLICTAPTSNIILIKNQNSYNVTEGEQWAGEKGGKQIEPGVIRKIGVYSSSQAHFDDIRVIPSEGCFVSTPFFGGDEVEWGTISWNDDPSSKTGLKIYLRSASGGVRDSTESAYLSGTDDFSYEAVNNQKISSAGNWIQYKAVLSSSAFTTGDYSGSSVTPALEDVTITYLPRVEVLYWREERE